MDQEQENEQAQKAVDPMDFSAVYNTTLTPEEEAEYEAWANGVGRAGDVYDYDLRGAWKEGTVRSMEGHFPDTFKKPNHPTFSDESIYNGVDGYQGGHWSEEGPDTNSWTFTPGETNLKFRDSDQLVNYFNEAEPEAKLILNKEEDKKK